MAYLAEWLGELAGSPATHPTDGVGERKEVWHLSPRWLGSEPWSALEVRQRRLACIDHRAVLQVHHQWHSPPAPTLVLAAASRVTFEQFYQQSTTEPSQVMVALVDVLQVIAAAHRVGLIHGYLHPQSLRMRGAQICVDLMQLDVGLVTHYPDLGLRDGMSASIDVTTDLSAAQRMVAGVLEMPRIANWCQTRHAPAWKALQRLVGHDQTRRDQDRELVEIKQLLAHLAPWVGRPDQLTLADVSRPTSIPGTVAAPLGDTHALDTLDVDLDDDLARVPAPPPGKVGDRLGRFQLDAKLGQGGMGAVYRAIDLTNQQVVAIKLLSELRSQQAQAVRRFQKEARMLARLNNPHITNLIEINEDQGIHYLVLEYVEGVDLKQLLARVRVVPERFALLIAAHVCRALADAHRQGIVHRDIKPENILLEGSLQQIDLAADPPSVKLADFGIARQMDQSESLALTQAGALVGTPLYMSPEQCRGEAQVVPPSDIYSLGVTLYEMLTGQPPFRSPDTMQLAAMHTFEVADSVRQHNAAITEATEQLVARCLAKQPTQRFADASHLLRVIDRQCFGEVQPVALRPVLPPHDAGQMVETTMVWTLKSSPQELWPYVTNTERLNRAAGLPAVEYRTEATPQGTRRWGTLRLAGITLTWEEHPYEWVEGTRMSVLREFSGGPFVWFMSCVTLEPLAQGTRLTHRIKILPRNWWGRWIARRETGPKCQQRLGAVYERMDATLVARASAQTEPRVLPDAFELPHQPTERQRGYIAEGIARLLGRGVELDLAERLETFLLSAPAQQLVRVRPLALAAQWRVDEIPLIDMLLLAVSEGLLTLGWDLLCPTCRVSAQTEVTLQAIAAHTHCEACHLNFATDRSNAVELVLRADERVRDTQLGQYCIGGPWHAPHVVAQIRLEPHERLEVELGLMEGEYLLRGPQLPRSYDVRVQPQGALRQLEVSLSPTPDAQQRLLLLRSGQQQIVLENQFAVPQLVRVERTIPRADVLTAAHVSTMSRFRQLFPQECLTPGRTVAAEAIAFLATGIPQVDEFYRIHGDEWAYTAIRQQLVWLEAAIAARHGELVKTTGEGILAVFPDPQRAVQAALEMSDAWQVASIDQPVPLVVAVHYGPAMLTTVNGRLDYFGTTPRQALALPPLFDAGVAFTEALLAVPRVAQYLETQARVPEPRRVELLGQTVVCLHL